MFTKISNFIARRPFAKGIVELGAMAIKGLHWLIPVVALTITYLAWKDPNLRNTQTNTAQIVELLTKSLATEERNSRSQRQLSAVLVAASQKNAADIRLISEALSKSEYYAGGTPACVLLKMALRGRTRSTILRQSMLGR